MEKIVIIPTYNEIENIEAIIAKVFSMQQGYHILVIDDGSPDGTPQAVKKMMQQYPDQLFIEERKGKLGLGTAYIHGFKWSIAKGYNFIFDVSEGMNGGAFGDGWLSKNLPVVQYTE